MTARTVAIIQARMGSTRLPAKVLLPLLGRPILSRVVERTARAKLVDEVVVATTVDPSDKRIVDLAVEQGWTVERGSESDLLDRYTQVARAHDADIVVRITSDCPLIDPALIDETIEAFVDGGADYASSSLEPRTYPRGLDVEVIGRVALERAWREDGDPAWREHVTPYLYHHPDEFRLIRVSSPDDQSHHRWCVDTVEDYELVKRIYEALGADDFTWRQALEVVDSHPSWASINRDVVQKVVPATDAGS
jgi:spore coat polysaccharide biosynthesis protein SpsF